MPNYYNRDLFKKIQLLKQGTKSVEEYYKEMEIAMIRANVMEDDEQTMARFLNGLNHPIKKIADFQPYSNLIELVHQPTKAKVKYKTTSSMPSSHPSPTASPTPKLQQLQHLLPQPSHLQATTTSQVTRKLRQPQVALLLQATSSRELLHHLPQPMKHQEKFLQMLHMQRPRPQVL